MNNKNKFAFFDVCKPTNRRGNISSNADVLSTCNPSKDNNKKIIWRMSFSESVIKATEFIPGETRLVFNYHEGLVVLTENSQGRLLSKPSGKTSRARVRFALPRELSGYIERGALPEAETGLHKIYINML